MNSESYKSGDWIISLSEIDNWLNKFQNNNTSLAVGFCSLKRIVTEQTHDPKNRTEGFELIIKFLDLLEEWFQNEKLDQAELVLSFGILMTILGEFGPYRFETKRDEDIKTNIIQPFENIRSRCVEITKTFFQRADFDPIRGSILHEINPLIDSTMVENAGEKDRFMPFRIIQTGKIAERLHQLSQWLQSDPSNDKTKGLQTTLKRFYDLKYPRFGTSGLRGIWEEDFTEIKAKRTAQSIYQYLADKQIPDYVIPQAENLENRWMVIGYDGRRNSTKVAKWLSEIAIRNGFKVKFASRATPTPALAFYETHILDRDKVAGLLNCTASHNPSEWQGIKFNPRDGYPAPTHLTNIIAERINEMQLLDVSVEGGDLDKAEKAGDFDYFDPLPAYWEWLKENGINNLRIPLNLERMSDFYSDKLVIIDEMHGAARGYLGHILGELGIRHQVIHAERDLDLGGLDYANPELPFIEPLMEAVKERDAFVGFGMDTDGDRFGVVDVGGKYFRPNQILAMLAYYLTHELKLEGRMVITQTGLPMINFLVEGAPGLKGNLPDTGVIPAYVDHPFYKRRTGEREDMAWDNVFVVPVGIKYIAEIPRMDHAYKLIREEELKPRWMDDLLLGGEESSGLTTRGHVPDKDGVWANLLIMDMIAYFGKPLNDIWKIITSQKNTWDSFGGRTDVDASDNAKEGLINKYLDHFIGKKPGDVSICGYPVQYAGGIRYDLVEIFLGNDDGEMRNFLRIRASGTEPINRVYTETENLDLWKELQNEVLTDLDNFSIQEIRNAYRIERLVDILSTTKPNDWISMAQSIHSKLKIENWKFSELKDKLSIKQGFIEKRNRDIINEWILHLNQK